MVDHFCFSSAKEFQDTISTLNFNDGVQEVFDSGFLCQTLYSEPQEWLCAFLPIEVRNKITHVLLIGKTGSEQFGVEDLDTFLGLASLVGATAQRLASQQGKFFELS